jgi:GNAT superfamily N-acetyltransferase
MSIILDDFSEERLALAIKQNLYELFRYLHHWYKAEFHETLKLRRWWTPVPYPWFNGVISLQPPAVDETDVIRENIEYFRSQGREVFTWWLAPGLEASAWGPQLLANGLKVDSNTPGMAINLNFMLEGIPVPDGLKILRVTDEAMMRAWAETFVAGYGLPPDWTPPLLDMMLTIGMDMPHPAYLATIRGEPVGTAAMFYGAGVAGVQMVATLPNWRGKGIGAAITQQPLIDARNLGYRIGILQSSNPGYSVYKRLGFQEFCRMTHYYWEQE